MWSEKKYSCTYLGMTKLISNLPSENTRKAILIKECRYIPAAVSCMRLKELKKSLSNNC